MGLAPMARPGSVRFWDGVFGVEEPAAQASRVGTSARSGSRPALGRLIAAKSTSHQRFTKAIRLHSGRFPSGCRAVGQSIGMNVDTGNAWHAYSSRKRVNTFLVMRETRSSG